MAALNHFPFALSKVEGLRNVFPRRGDPLWSPARNRRTEYRRSPKFLIITAACARHCHKGLRRRPQGAVLAINKIDRIRIQESLDFQFDNLLSLDQGYDRIAVDKPHTPAIDDSSANHPVAIAIQEDFQFTLGVNERAQALRVKPEY